LKNAKCCLEEIGGWRLAFGCWLLAMDPFKWGHHAVKLIKLGYLSMGGFGQEPIVNGQKPDRLDPHCQRKMRKTLFLVVIGLITSSFSPFWGFHAHKEINRLAVYTLPPEMIAFYKKNIRYLTEASVNPDKRRYAVQEEGARHYLDVDHFGDSILSKLPTWREAVEIIGDDTLQAHGVLPWHVFRMYARLKDAFAVRDADAILKTSAELGHYIADAHVPLHTTKNYNGQLTGQEGIHGLWESRLPELFCNDYNFFVGKAQYISDPQKTAWQIIFAAHALTDRVLDAEKKLSSQYNEKKYSFETRGNATIKVYAVEYADDYHRRLEGMVEEQMRRSIKTVGDFWYTAWVEAGQPDLRELIDRKLSPAEVQRNREALEGRKAEWRKVRMHE
jgi:hypothetical protein